MARLHLLLVACLIAFLACATVRVQSQGPVVDPNDDIQPHSDVPTPVAHLVAGGSGPSSAVPASAPGGFLEVDTEAEAETEVDLDAEAEADSELDTEADAELDADAEADAEAEAEADAEAEAEDQAEADADSEEGADVDAEAETDADMESEAEAEVAVPWYPLASKVEKGMKSGTPFNQANKAPFKIVLHSTEGSTAAGAEAAYIKDNKGINPHFTVTFEKKAFEVHQHIPVTHSARALAHPKGTCETNNANAIQIEIVGFAKSAPSFDPKFLDGIADLLAWIQQQYPTIKPIAPPKGFVAYPSSYGIANAARLDCPTWTAFNGVAGHQHVPGNNHGDPGQIDIVRVMKKMKP